MRSMVWSHNDSWLLSGDHAGYVKYWQSNMNNVQMYEAHHEPIRGLRLGSVAAAMHVAQMWLESVILRVAVNVGIVQIYLLLLGCLLENPCKGFHLNYITLNNITSLTGLAEYAENFPKGKIVDKDHIKPLGKSLKGSLILCNILSSSNETLKQLFAKFHVVFLFCVQLYKFAHRSWHMADECHLLRTCLS